MIKEFIRKLLGLNGIQDNFNELKKQITAIEGKQYEWVRSMNGKISDVMNDIKQDAEKLRQEMKDEFYKERRNTERKDEVVVSYEALEDVMTKYGMMPKDFRIVRVIDNPGTDEFIVHGYTTTAVEKAEGAERPKKRMRK